MVGQRRRRWPNIETTLGQLNVRCLLGEANYYDVIITLHIRAIPADMTR